MKSDLPAAFQRSVLAKTSSWPKVWLLTWTSVTARMAIPTEEAIQRLTYHRYMIGRRRQSCKPNRGTAVQRQPERQSAEVTIAWPHSGTSQRVWCLVRFKSFVSTGRNAYPKAASSVHRGGHPVVKPCRAARSSASRRNALRAVELSAVAQWLSPVWYSSRRTAAKWSPCR